MHYTVEWNLLEESSCFLFKEIEPSEYKFRTTDAVTPVSNIFQVFLA